MRPAQLHDPRLHHPRDLMSTRQRLEASVDQGAHPASRVLAQPVMHGLARHPVASGDVGHPTPPPAPPAPPHSAAPPGPTPRARPASHVSADANDHSEG